MAEELWRCLEQSWDGDSCFPLQDSGNLVKAAWSHQLLTAGESHGGRKASLPWGSVFVKPQLSCICIFSCFFSQKRSWKRSLGWGNNLQLLGHDMEPPAGNKQKKGKQSALKVSLVIQWYNAVRIREFSCKGVNKKSAVKWYENVAHCKPKHFMESHGLYNHYTAVNFLPWSLCCHMVPLILSLLLWKWLGNLSTSDWLLCFFLKICKPICFWYWSWTFCLFSPALTA